MQRRTFLGTALAVASASPLFAALRGERWEDAAEVLQRSTAAKLVEDAVPTRHLLTHVSGLPDQLANNNELRKQHAPLTEFAEQALRTRLDFAPGARYQYSSMGILLAARIAELLSGSDMLALVDRTV